MACFLVDGSVLPHHLVIEVANRAAVLRLRGVAPVLAAIVFPRSTQQPARGQVILHPQHIQSWPQQQEGKLSALDEALLRWMEALRTSDTIDSVLVRLSTHKEDGAQHRPDSEMFLFSRAALVHPQLA